MCEHWSDSESGKAGSHHPIKRNLGMSGTSGAEPVEGDLQGQNADTIIGNMDSRIFLGGSEPTTLKELNQALGKETIDLYNTSDTRGNSPSYGTNYQKVGHDLASVDELAVLDGGKCILQLRGVRPLESDKYDLTQHPNYKLTAGADKKNTFSIETFLDHRLKLKPGDKYEVVDADHAK